MSRIDPLSIALSGIAVLNGLVMVSSVQDLIRSGMDRAEATTWSRTDFHARPLGWPGMWG